MTKSQITCFLEIVRQGSFSRAAEQLVISQPAVSKHISQLEHELAVPLFYRTHNSARLTPGGKLLYDFFEKFQQDFATVLDSARQAQSIHAETLRLGCLDGWDTTLFSPQIRNYFREKQPQLQIHLYGYNHSDLIDALISGEIDAALTLGLTLQGQHRLSVQPVFQTSAVLLCSSSHPLAARKFLSLSDFRDEPFLVVAPPQTANIPMLQMVIDMCKQAGFSPRLEALPSSSSVHMRLLSDNGVTITTQWTRMCRDPQYLAIPLDTEFDVCVVWANADTTSDKSVFVRDLLSILSSSSIHTPPGVCL